MSTADPLRRRFKLSVALPASIIREASNLRDKTVKIGFIGRALAVFRVDEVIIYRDLHGLARQDRDASLIASLLSYMETPQYLRRKVFPISKNLSYAGLLPPLKTLHHPTVSKAEHVKDGEFRDGLVISHTRLSSIVDIGLNKPVKIHGRFKLGLRVTVRLFRRNGELHGETVSKDDIPFYWGYRVLNVKKPLGRVLNMYKDSLKIATSKYGDSILNVSDKLRHELRDAGSVLVLFGSPREGLAEILSREGLNIRDCVDFTVNFIPHQGSKTVRTEEALYAVLALLNYLAP